MSRLMHTEAPSEATEEYSLEVLVEMRRACMQKPAGVSDEQWALALPREHQSSRAKIEKAIRDGDGLAYGSKTLISLMFPDAVLAMHEILTDPGAGEKTRASLAMWVADQHAGKATQAIEHSGNFQLEFRKAAEELEARYKTLQLQAPEATETAPVDTIQQAVDSFLESQVGEDFKVGMRGEESEQES